MQFPKHFHISSDITTSSATAISVPALQCRVGDASLESFSAITLDTEVASVWDSIETDYTDANIRKGLDFFLYCCIPTSGRTPKLLLSASSTYPSGYDATNSRKIGGFHCLCLSVGNISGHTLTGKVTGDILPQSLWWLTHRALSGNNAGKVFDPDTGLWCGIYLSSLSGSTAVSVFGGTIRDTLTWFTAVDECANGGTRLPKDDEFSSLANGSPEGTNISGSADPVTTGGHVDTAGRRIISNIGCEDCTGVSYQWLDEQGYRFDSPTQHTHSLTASGEAQVATSGNQSVDVAPAWGWKNVTGGKGRINSQGTYGTTKSITVGKWNDGVNNGSLGRYMAIWPWASGTDTTSRFVEESKEL